MDVNNNPVMPDYRKILDNMRQSVRRYQNSDYLKRLEDYQAERFDSEIKRSALSEFGEYYTQFHDPDLVTSKAAIFPMIQETIQYRRGFYISGIPGAGKTHILLEFYYRIMQNEFKRIWEVGDYPMNYPAWIKKTCKYYYSSWISDLIQNHEKPIVAKFNLIDDLFVEELNNYILAGWNAYFEEINRRGCVMILSSNVSLKDLKAFPQYCRIISRIAGNCRNIELPTKDRRIK